jgi:hydrogenase maturation factor HypF (carbamoyltransferase family)
MNPEYPFDSVCYNCGVKISLTKPKGNQERKKAEREKNKKEFEEVYKQVQESMIAVLKGKAGKHTG